MTDTEFQNVLHRYKDLEGDEREERGTVCPSKREEPCPDKCESARSPAAARPHARWKRAEWKFQTSKICLKVRKEGFLVALTQLALEESFKNKKNAGDNFDLDNHGNKPTFSPNPWEVGLYFYGGTEERKRRREDMERKKREEREGGGGGVSE